MHGFWIRVLVALVALTSVTTLAHAEPNAAEQFDRGLVLFRGGRYSEAADAFFAAYQKSPHADSLYNAGLAWELAGELARAATAYELALEKELKPDAREDATRRRERLARTLGRIEMAVPEGATVRVPPFAIRSASPVFFLEPGRHRIRVTLADDTPLARRVRAAAGETTVVLVETSSSESEPEASPRPRRTAKGTPDGGGSPDLRTAGYISLGVSAVAVGAAIVLGLETLSARDDWDASGHTDRSARDRAERMMLWTNVAWATAAVAGVTGGVLILTTNDGGNGVATGARVMGRF